MRLTRRRPCPAGVVLLACAAWARASLAVDPGSSAAARAAADTAAERSNPGSDTKTAPNDSSGDAANASAAGTGKASPKVPSAADTDVALGTEAALSRNLSLYDNGQYEDCVRGLRQLLDTSRGPVALRPDQVDQASIYLGACLIASGRPDDADTVFGNAIRNNPQMRAPDSLVFPQTVVDRFLRVREHLLSDIRKEERDRVHAAEQRAQARDEQRRRELQRYDKLRDLARSESVVEKNKRWLALVPFGVGQFQNGDLTAGWIFFGVETALAGTCVAAVVIDKNLANRELEPGIDRRELNSKRNDAYWVEVASSWGFLAVAAGGILHAQLRFVPERRHLRSRQLPPDLDGPAPSRGAELKQTTSARPFDVSLTGIRLGPIIGVSGQF